MPYSRKYMMMQATVVGKLAETLQIAQAMDLLKKSKRAQSVLPFLQELYATMPEVMLIWVSRQPTSTRIS